MRRAETRKERAKIRAGSCTLIPFFQNFKDVQTILPKELRIAQRQRRWGGGFAHERKPFALELIHGHPGMFKETAHQGCLCRSWCAYVIMTI